MSGRLLFWIALPVLLVTMVITARQGAARWMASYHLQQVETLMKRLKDGGHLERRESQRGLVLAFDQAVELLRDVQKMDPSRVEIPAVRGGLHRLRRRPKAALEAYQAALALEPRPEVFRQMGHVYRSLGREEEAREAYHAAILLDHTLARDLRPFLDGKKTEAKKRNNGPRPEAKGSGRRGENSNE